MAVVGIQPHISVNTLTTGKKNAIIAKQHTEQQSNFWELISHSWTFGLSDCQKSGTFCQFLTAEN